MTDPHMVAPHMVAHFDQLKADADKRLDEIVVEVREILRLVDGDVYTAFDQIADELAAVVASGHLGAVLDLHLVALLRLAQLPDRRSP